MWLLEVGDNSNAAESQVWGGHRGGDLVPDHIVVTVFLFSISNYVAWSQALAFPGLSLSICEMEIKPTTNGMVGWGRIQ